MAHDLIHITHVLLVAREAPVLQGLSDHPTVPQVLLQLDCQPGDKEIALCSSQFLMSRFSDLSTPAGCSSVPCRPAARRGHMPKTIQFLCTQDYNHQQCVEDAKTLRQELAPYPLARLGTWSFVLVPADDWRGLVRSQGGDP
jgi:hypothetical protein